MITKLFDFFILSFKNLQRRKLRSWLTTIGVVIGICTVVALTSISVGMQEALEEVFTKLGKDKLLILPGQKSFSPGTLFIGKPFTEQEVRKIEKLPSVDVVIPITYSTEKVYFRNEMFPTIVTGVPVDASEKLGEVGYELLDGRFFKKVDKNKCVVILGYHLAKSVFSRELTVGDKIRIDTVECKVVGILKSTGSRFDDFSVMIPLSTAKNLFGMKDIQMIIVKANDLEKAKRDIEKTLKKTRGEDFTIMTMGQMVEYAKTSLGIISLVVIAIASISLIVSAVGIMNTMYMAVTERTREIGLLKALGAKDYEILLLFLLESGLLGMVGGIIGAIFGILGAKIVEFFAVSAGYPIFRAAIDIKVMVGAIFFAFVIGIISGLAPARSAAKLNPVEALRYE